MNPQIKDFTDAQLEELYGQISQEMKSRELDKELFEKKALVLNGVSIKDFIVEYQDQYTEPGDKHYNPFFSFYIKHGKKKYDVYYDWFDYKKDKPLSWWPVEEDNDNAIYRFIPNGFSEAVENGYEYDGTVDEAIACLKKHGFASITNRQE